MLYSTKSAAFAAFMAAGVSSVAACGQHCSHSHDAAEHHHEHNHDEVQQKFETTDADLDAMDVDGEGAEKMDTQEHAEHPQPRQLSEEELAEEAKKHDAKTLEKLTEVFGKLEKMIGLPPMNPVQMLFEMQEAPEGMAEGPLTAEDLLEQAEMVLNNPEFAQGPAGMDEGMEMPSMDDMDFSAMEDVEATEVDSTAEESKEDL